MNINRLFIAMTALLSVSLAPIAHAEELPSSAIDIGSVFVIRAPSHIHTDLLLSPARKWNLSI